MTKLTPLNRCAFLDMYDFAEWMDPSEPYGLNPVGRLHELSDWNELGPYDKMPGWVVLYRWRVGVDQKTGIAYTYATP